MKKLYLLIIFLLAPLISFAQITGTGDSSSDPYTGTMSSGTFNIPSATKYFNQITVTGGTLNIAAGATLYATATSSYITVSGTGVLNADGTPSSKITFTSNVSTWSRITYSSGGTSLLDNCIIEKGYVSGSGYGGGLLIRSDNLTVSNCEIRNNSAGYGGGIFIDNDYDPNISTCHIHDNTAAYAGGGMYIYTKSNAIVQNCLIEANTCTNTSSRGGGGISTYTTSGSPRIINCTIVNNTHNTPNTNYGNNIEIHDANAGLRYINCVVWGGSGTDPSVYRSGGAQFSATHFVNSAVQSVYSISGETSMGSYTNSFKINTSNTGSNPSGPYFSDPSTDNWTILFSSPCRDAGISSGTPTPPSTDYLGNQRIFNYDIGAYEVQYSRWTGLGAGWTDPPSWEQSVTPSAGTGDVIIPSGVSGYPDESSVTIGTGNYLIINPAAQATFTTLNNNGTGTLWLKSDSYGVNDSIASLKVDTYVPNGGNAKIELYLTGNGSAWHYISTPVSSLAPTVFSTASAAVADYQENLISDNMNNGWVTSTGYHYNPLTELWESGTAWSHDLTVGRAYNYYSATSKTFTIQGTINTSLLTYTLRYNSSGGTEYPSSQGWNLIGNPFTCGLDWQEVLDSYGGSWPPDVEKSIYFRRGGATYYFNNGVTNPNTIDGITLDGRYIPPMQGFFIKTGGDLSTVTIPGLARVHTINHRYKGSGSIIPLVRLQIDNNGNFDQSVVRFDEKATTAFDSDFDSRKIFPAADLPSISSSLGGIEYAINGVPFPETPMEIPLIFNAPETGSFTISANEINGLENYRVYLTDYLLSSTINLNEIKNYAFTSVKGTITDRFVLTVTNLTTAIPENKVSKTQFNIFQSNEMLNIQVLNDNWNDVKADIRILDMTGRLSAIEKNTYLDKGEIKQISINPPSGIYFVEITSGVQRYVGKVVVR